MKSKRPIAFPLLLFASLASAAEPLKVNPFNFARAETDTYFAEFVKKAGGLGRFEHVRVPTAIDGQTVIRMNRDTLYSSAVFDLDAGPVTLTLPNAGKRLMSLMVVNQDHYALEVHYAPAAVKLSRESVGTRYVAALFRTFMDPNNPADIRAANSLQDAIKVQQASAGEFESPEWDKATHKKTRDLLLELSAMGGAQGVRFGRKEEVDPINFLLSTAAGWGGNPPTAAVYEAIDVPNSDGKAAYTLTLKDVPVDGFWSVTVYDAKGFMFENPQKAYSVNNVTASASADGSVKIQFGGDPKGAANFLAITRGWNLILRLYRPRKEILDGSWKAPALRELNSRR